MAEVIEITDPTHFDETLAQLRGQQDFVVVYITGGEDASGKNWCGDCTRAKPNITNYVLNQTEGKVLKAVVVDKTTWGPSHPYKKHSVVKARSVPTLLLFNADGEVLMRAENDEDFDNIELLTAIAKHE